MSDVLWSLAIAAVLLGWIGVVSWCAIGHAASYRRRFERQTHRIGKE
jgi:hypothetical protein